MKLKNIKKVLFVIVSGMIFSFVFLTSYYLSLTNPMTFTGAQQDPEATIEKYKDVWDDTTIKKITRDAPIYIDGEEIGTITIPGMNIYELPIIYGSSEANKNWQVTALSKETNWSMIGETGITAIGAHNYQLFTLMPTLQPGEKFIIETDIDTYVYEIVDKDIYIEGEDVWKDVVWKDRNNYSVNLITCYPVDEVATPDRMILFTKMTKGTIIAPTTNEN